MPNSEEQVSRSLEEQKPQVSGAESANTDQALESQAAGFEGKVAEAAKTSAGENAPSTGSAQQDDGGQQTGPTKDELKDDRAALKAKLLKKAPKETVMRKEVEKKLLKKKDKLEGQIAKHRRKKDYHMLGLAVMQLRLVVKQLEELAKAGYEKLKDMWLQVVHKLA